ncbi:MAG: hypothetical protein HYT42_00260, partial [Candidatus Sungbacteria bacterium]|nr:hypothetical protein [Candidatus Sungbacteria bacterium]
PQSVDVTYTTITGSPFTPKVFVQRGAAANEDRADTPVTVNPAFDYTLGRTQSAVSVAQGSSGTNTIIVTTTTGTPSAVSFDPTRVTGLPAGATASFSPSSCIPPSTPGSNCSTTITLSVGSSVAAGTYTVAVQDNGPLLKTTSFDLVVTTFTFSLSKSNDISVVQGATTGNTATITVTPTGGTSAAVTFSATGLSPSVASISFNPTFCNPGATTCTSVMTVLTFSGDGATPTGSYPITVTGTSGSSVNNTTVNLAVASEVTAFLTAPSSAVAGTPVRLTADITKYTGGSLDTINYKFWKHCISGESQNPTAIITACGQPDAEFNGVTADPQLVDLTYASTGSFTPKVFVQRGSAADEDRVDASVNVIPTFDYTLSNSGNITVQQGQNGAVNMLVTHVSGTPGTVSFDSSLVTLTGQTGLPAGVTVSFSPVSCTPPTSGSCSPAPVLTLRTNQGGVSTPAETYSITVTDNTLRKTTSFNFTVNSAITVALSSLPSASGPAPFSASLRAVTSGYTGSLSDSINYSFWWNCNDPTNSPAAAVVACGDPANSAIGFKQNGTLDETFTTPVPHVYNAEGVYFGKIIVERGSARKEQRIAITVGTPAVAVTSCSVTPVKAAVNQSVTWSAAATGGTAPYRYAWSRDVSCSVNPEICNSVSMSYTTTGTKFGTVTVTDAGGVAATKQCDNSVSIVQPTLVIDPSAVQVRSDGGTIQLAALYDSDGPSGSEPEVAVTANASTDWSVPLAEQPRATVGNSTQKGLVTAGLQLGTVTVTARYAADFGNILTATASVQVISRDAIVCDPSTQDALVNVATYPMKASGGTGTYDWLVDQIDANPRTGSTVGAGTFATTFSQSGIKTVRITSGSQTGTCSVNVSNQALAANLSAFPASVTVPDSTRLTAVVSGTAVGSVNYSFWWDCGSDKDADNTTRVEIAEGRCGVLPTNVPMGECRDNTYGAKCQEIPFESKAVDHVYAAAGAYSPKVITQRGTASVQAKSSVTVDAANRAPIAVSGVSVNPSADRSYSSSVTVVQNVPTRLYFGAFTGSAASPDAISSDLDGWTSVLNGIYHPASASAAGRCSWNTDLDQNAQVSFEDESGTNRNPASPQGCVTSGVYTFTNIGSVTYSLLRITDNRGTLSNIGTVRVDIVAAGAPVATAGISSDPNANRVYRDVVSVKQGEDVRLWVSAKRRVGTTDELSSDPDGWTAVSGGVSSGGSCRWNRDLDRGAFPTGVPTYEWVIDNPLDPAEDCNTQLVNEAATSFTRTFSDAPGTYAYEALRIFDNSGLRSNKGLISVEVLPSAAPVAVPTLSTNGGLTFATTTTVVRGEPTTILFSGAGSSDPDGWTNPVNGVSTAGTCDWNSDLNQGAITFEDTINAPGSPSACNLQPITYTFNDRPGILTYEVLQVTDNKGITSSIGTVGVVVTAPDLVVSNGPVPTATTTLIAGDRTRFAGTIKNQGDAGTLAVFSNTFKIDLGNDGVGPLAGYDLVFSPDPTITGLAMGAEQEVTSAEWSNIPAGTHKVTLCPAALSNEYFVGNNCRSEVVTVLPANNTPVAEVGISLDGATYGLSVTVVRGVQVNIWLSADADVNGNGRASYDLDGWAHETRGIATGGKCEWNIDLAKNFAVQNTVNNPSSPTICNRGPLTKTFNDNPGTYIYPALRITDAKGAQSSVANVSVTVVATEAAARHFTCFEKQCREVAGSGANTCGTGGLVCGALATYLPDLVVSHTPEVETGAFEIGRTATISGKIRNNSTIPITVPFDNAFLIDLNNNGTIDLTLNAKFYVASRKGIPRILASAALPPADLNLPLPPTVGQLGSETEVKVISGNWSNIPAGTHRIFLCGDSGGEVTESNETNNCSSFIAEITAPLTSGPLNIDSCSASPSSVGAGDEVLWSATVSGGTGQYAFSWSGSEPLEGRNTNPALVTYSAAGTKSGSLTVTSGSETANRGCGTVSVVAGIVSFTASPLNIVPGQSSTLSWNSDGLGNCVINQGIGPVSSPTGTRIVSPENTTTYTLTCDGASRNATVTVGSV